MCEVRGRDINMGLRVTGKCRMAGGTREKKKRKERKKKKRRRQRKRDLTEEGKEGGKEE